MAGKRAPEDVRRGQILQAAFEVASREGIGRLTIREVAARAEVSHALVVHYFQRKERLVHALLDWLLDSMSVLHVSGDVVRLPRATDRLHALLRQELERQIRQPKHLRLFFEFWAIGASHEGIGARIAAELESYRAAFREVMRELLLAEPATFAGATAEGMAEVAVSWIYGGAVQAMIDPAQFGTDEFLAAVRGMIGRTS